MKEVYASLKLEAGFECPHCGADNYQDAGQDTNGDNFHALLEALGDRWNGENYDDKVDIDGQTEGNRYVCDDCNKEIIITHISW